VFNIGDWLGRYICTFPRLLIWSSRRLLVLAFFRTLFIPLFLTCNIKREPLSVSPPTNITVPLINSDFLYILILLAFGISNGYVATMGMMSAPSLEHNANLKKRKELVDTAATVAQFCLIGGLAIGSAFSFCVRMLICRCNPFVA
jgi:equilibrative nucleoside transporter 1/2/3